ncbi:MAG: HEPN domain-containing protein [Candidatus Woesearchaeota archaeon]
MKVVKKFEEFIDEGIVKRISPDINRSENLLQESEKKYKLLNNNISKLGIDDDNANDFVEYCYNIIMFFIRAKMLEEGYSSSGQGAHEAEVAFARNLNLSEVEIEFLDQLRFFRNGILYYGKQFDKEYAEKVIKFTKEFVNKKIKVF